MVKTVTKRELNQNTAGVLEQVSASEDVVVTERGRPRWRVSAVRAEETVLDRLEREGRYTPPASEPEPWPEQPGGRSYTDAQVDALLNEAREDR